MIHELKTWPEVFAASLAGTKKFELRKDDRPFEVGHLLLLREWAPDTKEYSGRSALFQITFILRDKPEFGLPEDFCVLSIEKQDEHLATLVNLNKKLTATCDSQEKEIEVLLTRRSELLTEIQELRKRL